MRELLAWLYGFLLVVGVKPAVGLIERLGNPRTPPERPVCTCGTSETVAHPIATPRKGSPTMGGKHEDPNSPKAKDMDGTEGGSGSTNDHREEAQGEHAKGKGKKK